METILAMLLCILTLVVLGAMELLGTVGPFALGVIVVVWAIRKLRD